MARPARIAIAMICALCCASCGPRMRVQQSIRPYEQTMPAMPEETVPTKGSSAMLLARESSRKLNPLPKTPRNLRNGRIYYGYYCLMCHGEKGDGNGPVGQSYVPRPADLSSAAIAKMNDGQLYRAMLTGLGHDPVLIQTVPPQHRWPLVLYIRTFGR